jgi:hypothetical protein
MIFVIKHRFIQLQKYKNIRSPLNKTHFLLNFSSKKVLLSSGEQGVFTVHRWIKRIFPSQ